MVWFIFYIEGTRTPNDGMPFGGFWPQNPPKSIARGSWSCSWKLLPSFDSQGSQFPMAGFKADQYNADAKIDSAGHQTLRRVSEEKRGGRSLLGEVFEEVDVSLTILFVEL